MMWDWSITAAVMVQEIYEKQQLLLVMAFFFFFWTECIVRKILDKVLGTTYPKDKVFRSGE